MQYIKLSLLVILIIVLSFIGYIMLRPTNSTPVIEIPITTFDFGKVRFGDIPSHEFEIVNSGNEVLEIKKISTSCGCTTAEIDKTSIAAGTSATVTVYFNPAIHKDDTDLGELTRVVYINSNDPLNPEVELKIQANVYKEEK